MLIRHNIHGHVQRPVFRIFGRGTRQTELDMKLDATAEPSAEEVDAEIDAAQKNKSELPAFYIKRTIMIRKLDSLQRLVE